MKDGVVKAGETTSVNGIEETFMPLESTTETVTV
jgi:hypothetical protein